MVMESEERFVSRGIKNKVDGLLVNEIWRSWDKTKLHNKEDVVSFVQVRPTGEGLKQMMIQFTGEQMAFTVKSNIIINEELVIVKFGDHVALMLKSEADDIFKEVEDYGSCV